jgi:hypothetical protein
MTEMAVLMVAEARVEWVRLPLADPAYLALWVPCASSGGLAAHSQRQEQ